MSIFDFVTQAGSKLGQKIHEYTTDDIDITAPVDVSPERINELRAQSITKNVEDSGIVVQNLNVSVDNMKAVLEGKVNTQACSETLTLIAGNQHGIGTVDCLLEVANPEPQTTLYTVKSGDTLGKIAQEFYGNAAKYIAIFEANTPLLEDPDKIYVGQTLRIPSA